MVRFNVTDRKSSRLTKSGAFVAAYSDHEFRGVPAPGSRMVGGSPRRSRVRQRSSRLRSGDVVVVRAGYPGRAAVITDDLDGAQCASILILRRSEAVLPAYLAAFFNSAVARSQISAYQYGAAQEQVNVGHVVDFQFPMTDISTQAKCVDAIAESDAATDRLTAALSRQIDLLREHRQALITSVVTGELTVPGAV